MISLDSSIVNICRYEYSYFLDKANVQGIGLAYKVINGCTTNMKCICVMVSKKLKDCLLSSNNIIPKFYKGIATDVIVTEEYKILSLDQRVRPVIGGYSVGPAGIITSGSSGGLVKDDNGLYVLCNNHVFAAGNRVPIGNPILQPSTEDGGSSPNDVIGNLDRFVPLKPPTSKETPENIVDCAIAKVTNPTLVSSHITFIGIPVGVATPTLGMIVQLSCASSEYIFTSIKALGVTVRVPFFSKRKYLFVNQIILNHGAKEGDSGALVLTGGRAAVGLLFAGSSTEIICNPIDAVLDGLNVTLVTE